MKQEGKDKDRGQRKTARLQARRLRYLIGLTPQEARVLVLRYGIGGDRKPTTLADVASILRLTRERVGQVERRIIRKLEGSDDRDDMCVEGFLVKLRRRWKCDVCGADADLPIARHYTRPRERSATAREQAARDCEPGP